MNVDVICLSNSKNQSLVDLTSHTLQSIHDSEKDIVFDIHLLETNIDLDSDSIKRYENLTKNLIFPNEKFNYNKFINLSYPYLSSDWVVITNNDVIYERKWFSEILKIHKDRPDIESFSPKDPHLYANFFRGHFKNSKSDYWENYSVSEGLMGWSLIMKRKVFDLVYPWDEQFDLYYQDNDYAENLKKLNIKHALVRDSLAIHLTSQTIEGKFGSDNEKNKKDSLKFTNKWGLK